MLAAAEVWTGRKAEPEDLSILRSVPPTLFDSLT
jgi:hypothetical protein